MTQIGIPYIFMRGGTSRGPFFQRKDLPKNPDELAEVLIAVLGSGHALNIDGIGGGAAVTTKVAMLSPSSDDWADIDYFFAQVSVEDKLVDFKPSCGNMLSGVAPAAIEMGLIKPQPGSTQVRIKAVNTEANIIATVQTPDGITYEGDTVIDGVPGTGSRIDLQFMDTVGGATGACLPSRELQNSFDGIDVTLMDVAMPMMIACAEDFGITGYETPEELDGNTDFMRRLEQVRLKAGAAMGLGDVTESVVPKVGLVAPARHGGSVSARYFMPWNCHPTMAVTGAQCIASCLITPGSVAHRFIDEIPQSPANVIIEHPIGAIDVVVEFSMIGSEFVPESAGLVRTARKLADGTVYISKNTWKSQ